MSASKVVGLDAYLKKLKKELTEYSVDEQTNRLIAYAKRTIIDIADAIQFYGGKHHMDDTGNLLDSLCWGLAYKGKVVATGFYREQRATKLSYLHAWSDYSEAYPVGGHTLAEKYLQQYTAVTTDGWRLFFAVLAPYWGYWEEGFMFKGKNGHKFLKFSVMTQYYDRAGRDLKPAKVTFKTEAPPYSHSYNIGRAHIKGSMERRWSRYNEGKYDPYKHYPNKKYHYK